MTRIEIIIVSFLAIIIAGAVATFAYAQDGAGSVVAPSSMFYDLWTIVQPLVTLFVSIVGPVLVTWISFRIVNLLKITDEKQKVEIEAQLREALHKSAVNALNYAIAKAGLPVAMVGALSGGIMQDAIAYVQEKNPDALAKLGVHPDALRDIILSKVPDIAPALADKVAAQ